MEIEFLKKTAEVIWNQILATAKSIGGGFYVGKAFIPNIVGSWGVSKLGVTVIEPDGRKMPALVLLVNGSKYKGYVAVAYTPMDLYDVYVLHCTEWELVQDEVYFDSLTVVLDRLIETDY